MASDPMAILKEHGKRILKFSTNTKKLGRDKLGKTQIGVRRKLLDDYWAAFENEHLEVSVLAQSDAELGKQEYFVKEEYLLVEQHYQDAAAELEDLLGARSNTVNSAVLVGNNNAVQRTTVSGIRPIEPPVFNGDVTQWLSFRDMFTSLIMDNQGLGDVQRMHYLKIACKGEADEVIRDIAVTEANFNIAWTALKNRYENTRVIISKLIDKILSLPPMTTDNSGELRRLIDGTNQSLRALNAMQRATANWDDILVVLIVKKLDVKTRQVWERHISKTVDMPTYKELSDFLDGELRSLEAMKDVVSNENSNLVKKKLVRTHFIETKGECVMCHSFHSIHACDQFLKLSVANRREIVNRHNLCFNCLDTDSHISRGCKAKMCGVCNRKHHTLLHLSDNVGQELRSSTSPAFAKSSSSSAVTNKATVRSHVVNQPNFNVLLATALVKVKSGDRWIYARALIDPASHASIVTENLVQQLRSKRCKMPVELSGVGEASAGLCDSYVNLRVSGRRNDTDLDVSALVLKRITSNLPTMRVQKKDWPHLRDLPLADENYDVPASIDLLLGSGVYHKLLLSGVRKGDDGPIGQETIFDWILTGEAEESISKAPMVASFHVCLDLDTQLRKFWEQEEVEPERQLSMEEAACEQHFVETAKRGDDGRYTLQLPFRLTKEKLGESRSMAVRRLMQLEKRFAMKPELFCQYQHFMDEYLELGHMEHVLPSENEIIKHVYLPHHAVIKESSTSTRLRVVFDASQMTSTGHCLNDVLMTGPRLQDDLASILMRWRTHKIALSADVNKMYRQFWITNDHRDYQRIVWRRTPKEPIVDFRLKTITYGTSSAPYMAVRAMQQLARDEAERYPKAAEVVSRDFYMDDVLTGADTIEEALHLKNELLGLMQAGGLSLLKWSSNSMDVLQSLPENHRECRPTLDMDQDDVIKTLGIHWHPSTDQFGFKVTLSGVDGIITKRKVLSDIAKLFDPLALLAPIITTAKVMMQKLWLCGVNWDDELPSDICEKWLQYRAELMSIEDIRIDRWMNMKPNDTIEIHGFSDASMDAYAACVYLRVINQYNGNIQVALVAAKSKVSPIKQLSIPRLELNGAVLLCKLLGAVQKALQLSEVSVTAWTDSTVVLAWLQGHANRWTTFVANRVSVIQGSMNSSQWRHVPGIDNPADVASRGVMPSSLASHPLWWCGPHWLQKEEQHWPQRVVQSTDEIQLEEKKRPQTLIASISIEWELVNRYSSLNRLLRVTAYCMRVFRRVKDGEIKLQASEIHIALRYWIRSTQERAFAEEIAYIQGSPNGHLKGKLASLNAFIDEVGLLRVGGRLENSDGSYDEKHPYILPKHSTFTQLVVADAHSKMMHYGPKQTIAYLQQRFWILGVRSVVKVFIRRCVICFRARPTAQEQLMGNLPAERVSPSRAFLHTAIDYAGPVWARTSKGRGHKANKAWIAVFICLASKAIHLELVSDLTTDGFMAAYKRFTARRGYCSDVYCDNGTNFVGAAREMERQLQLCTKDEKWHEQICHDGTQFHFSPPGSPHFNGLAEAAVKLAKTALRKIIGEHTLTYEELTTFLYQVEAVLNSRPIGALSRDPNDMATLTPGHFLIGQPITAVPEPNLLDEKETVGNRWKLVQRLTQQFWQRWSKEYVHSLQQRQKWQSTNRPIEIGDVVLIRDEMLPATKWRLGCVEEVHPGNDGHVRVVTVRCGSSSLKRSIVKICVLPIEDNMH